MSKYSLKADPKTELMNVYDDLGNLLTHIGSTQGGLGSGSEIQNVVNPAEIAKWGFSAQDVAAAYAPYVNSRTLNQIQNTNFADHLRWYDRPASTSSSALTALQQTGSSTPSQTGTEMAMPTTPAGWNSYTPQQKIDFFNEKKVTPQQLLSAGVNQSDINWMQSQGYTGGALGGTTLPAAWNAPVPGPTPQQMASSAGVTLPAGWDKYTPAQKIQFFNAQGLDANELKAAGVAQSDIDWMKTQGYTGTPLNATTSSIPASQSTLSPNFSSYVYDMLAKGQAAANLPFQAFTGTRFAGPSDLQKQAFQGLAALKTPGEFDTAADYAKQVFDKAAGMSFTPTKFDTGLGALKSVEEYMSPYQSAVTDITAREMRRQADIAREQEQSRLAQAGAYGGSRQAIMEAERQRNLQQQLEDVTTKGLQSAYDRAVSQRLSEAGLGLQAQQGSEQSKQFGANFGLQSLQPMLNASSTMSNIGTQKAGVGLQNLQAQLMGGGIQQQLNQQPLDFGFQQWQDSVKFPYQQATYMHSLLGGLPLQAAPYSSSQGQSPFSTALAGGLAGLGLWQALQPK